MVLGAMSAPAFAQDAMTDSGDTAWILTASALVLMMTLPGLALFYAGLVRARNVLSVFMHCFAIASIASILWAICGYSLAFGPGSPFLGGLAHVGLANLAQVRDGTAISEPTFALFQMTFAIITPALIVGAFVERVRFGWLVPFMLLWSLFVYVPAARWVWGGGWLAHLGTLDYAGGIVVHTTAGVSALILALLIGKRQGFGHTLILPHSPALTLIGAGMLWVGWFGFNGGSALSASTDAALAILNTHLSAATASLCWIGLERIKLGKPTTIGLATGAVAGLATITPAAGQVGAMGAIVLGLIAGLVCFYAVQLIRNRIGIDDSLDVFAVHGVGGIIGSILLAPLAMTSFGGVGYAEANGMITQLIAQIVGVGAVALWSAIWTVVLALVVSLFLPMRVNADAEREGLDLASHAERGWELD
ncbi:ammonium transporter [Sphingobium sp. H33]|uniref:Ammonium transporter n=2 Tax=Sphingobium nicotianae TaxID=2782607 RepID=A0A9X1D852_9SPHN|nr:ammonium transporter [Sphingobium nicotianae]